jgi:hypothetical protein
MRYAAPATRIRCDLACSQEHGVEHLLGEPSGEGVLLADELRHQGLPPEALERQDPAVRES